MSKDVFDGASYSEKEFTPKELAQHREMFNEVRGAWPTVEGMDNLRKGGAQIVKIVAVLGVLGAVAGYFVQKGFL